MKPFCLLLPITLCTALAMGSAGRAASPEKKSQPAKRAANPAMLPIKDDPTLPRVLLIGDSISIGYTLPTRAALAGKANVHRPPANCGPTILGLKQIDQWLGEGKWDVIHFNWGLHDLKLMDGKHQVPLGEYEQNLRKLVERLKKTGAKLIWCSTTPVPEGVGNPPRSNQDVIDYNAAAKRIMDESQIPSDDLFAFALPRLKEIQLPQNVHFGEEGSKLLADQVAAAILKALKQPAVK
jgi:acyl-CoA thioesterase-1